MERFSNARVHSGSDIDKYDFSAPWSVLGNQVCGNQTVLLCHSADGGRQSQDDAGGLSTAHESLAWSKRRASRPQIQKRYDPLVWHIFSTCIQLKVRNLRPHIHNNPFDSAPQTGFYHLRPCKSSKFTSHGPFNTNVFYLFCQKEEVHKLHTENSWLTALLCKLKTLSCWRQLVDQGKLPLQLLQAQQVSSRTQKSNSHLQHHLCRPRF